MSGGKAKDGVIEQGGARHAVWMNNIAIIRGTTSVLGDSIKITGANGSALSQDNCGWITLPSTVTPGQLVTFQIKSSVTINLTGATWGNDTTGDLTGALLRVLAINDNGTLKWGVAKLGGRKTLLTTNTNATAASVDLPEEVLCNSAVASSSNRCREIGFVRANFDDTGGSSENLWTLQTGLDDIVTGETCDGYWQPWNPVYTGVTATVAPTLANWTQIGRAVFLTHTGSSMVSNSTSFSLTMPAKGNSVGSFSAMNFYTDNSVVARSSGTVQADASSTVLNLSTSAASGVWTGANNKSASFHHVYETGPAASFL